MTKNEEIKKVIFGLQFLKEKLYNGIFSDRLDCIDYAISAIKELQMYKDNKLCLVPEDVYSRQCCELDAYKAIGTVEECRVMESIISKVERNELAKIIDEWLLYRKIGTVEECREAVEKQKPKKPNRSGMDEQDYYTCPNCGVDIGSIDDYFPRDRYCHDCGQAIRWKNLGGMEDE